MKVTILCPRTPRLNYGGLENYTLRLCEKLSQMGHTAQIFTTSPSPQDNYVGKTLIREFPAFAPGDSYYFSAEAYAALRESDSDIIYSVGYNNLLTLAGLVAKKNRQKFIVSINLSGDPPPFRKALNVFYDMIVNTMAGRIDAVICVSPYELETFKKRLKVPHEKFHLLPMGIDIGPIRKVKAGRKGNYILSAGRFVRVKQFHNLILSFAMLAKKMPKIRLLLLGSGPLESELRRLAQQSGAGDRIDFTPGVPLDRIAELHRKMKESRLFVNLVDCGYEGIISYEAMACEVPVLLCDRKGKLEYVEKGYAQAIRDPENHAQATEKMLQMLKSPEKYTPKNPKIHTWEEITRRAVEIFEGGAGQ